MKRRGLGWFAGGVCWALLVTSSLGVSAEELSVESARLPSRGAAQELLEALGGSGAHLMSVERVVGSGGERLWVVRGSGFSSVEEAEGIATRLAELSGRGATVRGDEVSSPDVGAVEGEVPALGEVRENLRALHTTAFPEAGGAVRFRYRRSFDHQGERVVVDHTLLRQEEAQALLLTPVEGPAVESALSIRGEDAQGEWGGRREAIDLDLTLRVIGEHTPERIFDHYHGALALLLEEELAWGRVWLEGAGECGDRRCVEIRYRDETTDLAVEVDLASWTIFSVTTLNEGGAYLSRLSGYRELAGGHRIPYSIERFWEGEHVESVVIGEVSWGPLFSEAEKVYLLAP